MRCVSSVQGWVKGRTCFRGCADDFETFSHDIYVLGLFASALVELQPGCIRWAPLQEHCVNGGTDLHIAASAAFRRHLYGHP